jgi:hypothetical protein
MTDRSEDTTLREISDLPERQRVQVDLIENSFKELAQTTKHAETNFQAGYRLLLLKDYRSAMRCFEDCGFFASILARRYDTLCANIRQLREYTIICADIQETEDAKREDKFRVAPGIGQKE